MSAFQVTDKHIAYLVHAWNRYMKRFAGQLLTSGTFASDEFDRLYLNWIRARWDEGHAWTRSIWTGRP